MQNSFMGPFHSTLLALLVLFICKAKGATFTFVNKCDQTVWPGILGNPRLDSTGFELQKGSSRAFQAPTGWSGRFWGRTGCNFDESGQGSCATGDCGSGQIECNGSGATPPATLAEFTLGSGSQDFYDVSLVDGYNLPILVEVKGGSGPCASTGCIDDLNKKCPEELRIPGGGACKSACDAFGTPQYCCKGEYASPSTCTPSTYSQVFKSACPKSYSYAYDDASSTFTCTGADYTITFCPSGLSQKPSKLPDNSEGSNSGAGAGSGPGSESEPEPKPEQGSAAEEAMLANGAWLASLATGDSTRINPFGAVQFLAVAIAFVSLRVLFMHL